MVAAGIRYPLMFCVWPSVPVTCLNNRLTTLSWWPILSDRGAAAMIASFFAERRTWSLSGTQEAA